MANKGKRMLFEEDYEYLQEVIKNNPDPSDIGGGNKYVTIPSSSIGTALSDEDFDNLVNKGYDIILDDGYQTSIYYRNYENDNAIQFVQSELGEWHDVDAANILLYQLELNKTNKELYMNNNVATVIKANVTVGSSDTTVPLTNLQFNGYGDIYTVPSVPTDYVTTNTAQTITGVKTISGTGNVLNVKANSSNSTGIQFLNNSNTQIGNIYATRADADFTNSPLTMAVGINSTTSTGSTSGKDRHLGFKYASNNNGTMYYCNAMVPTRYTTSNTVADKCAYIPLAFTDGTNTVKSDETGKVDISTLLPTPTLTKTTDSFVITYQDNTTETITFLTDVTLS